MKKNEKLKHSGNLLYFCIFYWNPNLYQVNTDWNIEQDAGLFYLVPQIVLLTVSSQIYKTAQKYYTGFIKKNNINFLTIKKSKGSDQERCESVVRKKSLLLKRSYFGQKYLTIVPQSFLKGHCILQEQIWY